MKIYGITFKASIFMKENFRHFYRKSGGRNESDAYGYKQYVSLMEIKILDYIDGAL